LTDILASKDAAAVIFVALLKYCETKRQLLTSFQQVNSPSITMLHGTGAYCYKRIMANLEQTVPFHGVDDLVHITCFWACAAWARMHHEPLLVQLPQHEANGPHFKELYHVLEACRLGSIPDTTELEGKEHVLQVIDAAADHVATLYTQKGLIGVIAEAKEEPIWVLSEEHERMAVLVAVYSTHDVIGNLRRIFASLLSTQAS
jgi:hypothetical protein